MESKDYYKILQVDPAAEPEVIAAAYKRLALKYHPDTNKEPESNVKMQEINAAYQILSDPSKRAEYDLVRTEDETRAQSQVSKPEATDKKLIHQSDFFASSPYWVEDSTPQYRRFIKNGYYHIAVLSGDIVSNLLPFYLRDFRLYIDLQMASRALSLFDECGIIVIYKDQEYARCYDLSINPSGVAMLSLTQNGELIQIWDWSESPHIFGDHTFGSIDWKEYKYKREAGWGLTNRFMIEIKGQAITVGANKEILIKSNDNAWKGGYVGVYVRLDEEFLEEKEYAEARFRNFKLYSLES